MTDREFPSTVEVVSVSITLGRGRSELTCIEYPSTRDPSILPDLAISGAHTFILQVSENGLAFLISTQGCDQYCVNIRELCQQRQDLRPSSEYRPFRGTGGYALDSQILLCSSRLNVRARR